MNMRVFCLSTVFLLLLIVASGCKLETIDPDPLPKPVGSSVVVNELYILPPDRYYSYSWIEIYNPTDSAVNLLSLTRIDDSTSLFKAFAFTVIAELRVIAVGEGGYIAAVDTAEKIVTALGSTDTTPGVIVTLPNQLPSNSVLQRGKFYVITNNQNRFESHFRLGPYDPELIEIPTLNHVVQVDSSTFIGGPALWFPLPKGEVKLVEYSAVLKDTTLDLPFPTPGITFYVLKSAEIKTFDAVRYGGYRPNPDPTPGNIPAGDIPEYKSLARYAGYFKTGNTRDAFYIADDPLPGWYSQRTKR